MLQLVLSRNSVIHVDIQDNELELAEQRRKTMSTSENVAIDSGSLPIRLSSGYPEPYDQPCDLRAKQALGDAFGLTQYGVNIVTLPAGSWSSQRHWHSAEDELIYILEGEPTLVTNEGETQLKPGMCAGFRAGVENGHHLVNNTNQEVRYLEVGSRINEDSVDYPDIDMQVLRRGEGNGFIHRDGTPY